MKNSYLIRFYSIARITFTIIFTIFLLPVMGGQEVEADKIIGEWINEEKDTRIEIYKSGDIYNAKLISGPNLYEVDGQTARLDVQNSDKTLRTRQLTEVEILHEFKFEDGIWDDGKMYDPKSGKTYSSLMKIREDVLEIRSYVGIPLLGRSTYWTHSRSN